MSDTAVETINDIITAQGGTSDAKTIVEALEDLGEVIGGLPTMLYVTPLFLATSEAVAQTLATLEYGYRECYTPATYAAYQNKPCNMLVWFKEDLSALIAANPYLAADVATGKLYVCAEASNSTLAGEFAYDTEWQVS